MTTSKGPIQTGKKPYPFRTFWALLLLAGNILVALIYFRILNI
ncbi:photosystem I protein PsaX [Leptolyngbya sp. FACHB-261]|nr:photosystem I protein PsaX [Leptolyngbya sp. FACHB-261]MBD2101444.1 photosystem I protein PsaX [Leptolyngbya sp. FACHB-261]